MTLRSVSNAGEAGHPGMGAAVGAGGGLLVGTAAGASAGYGASGELQRRYDTAYLQCMYAKGNQVPLAVTHQPSPARASWPPPPPPGLAPPASPPPAPPGAGAPPQ